jgi:hypothetical protein
VDDFYKRLVQSNFAADTDADGLLTRDEYVQSLKDLAAADHRAYEAGITERHWNILNPTCKQSLDAQDMRAGLGRLLPVSVGHSATLKPTTCETGSQIHKGW